jgi:hypothetical protein
MRTNTIPAPHVKKRPASLPTITTTGPVFKSARTTIYVAASNATIARRMIAICANISQCAADSDHVFCQECSPDITQYDLDLENGQISCPACQEMGVRVCWNSFACGGKELDTLEGSSEWYKSPDKCEHVFCPTCDPRTPGLLQDCMIEHDIDVEKCPSCQDFEAY